VGEWVEVKRTWHDTAVTNCALCGRLVPRRVWQVEIAGQSLPFCNEECEGLYRSYWLPKYGDERRETGDGKTARRDVGRRSSITND
jgi:endogenous inhibitor of DNA gyrase (YacG/DUF329 family)